MIDKTIRELQSSLPWTAHYHRDFRSSPMTHKDFAHALLHVHKAGGKLSEIINDAEHRGVDWADPNGIRLKVTNYVADFVVCALRMANTCPDGLIDLQEAVQVRITGKNNQLADEASMMRASTLGPHGDEPKGGETGALFDGPIKAAEHARKVNEEAFTGRGENCRNGHRPSKSWVCLNCGKQLGHADGIHVHDPRNDPRNQKDWVVKKEWVVQSGGCYMVVTGTMHNPMCEWSADFDSATIFPSRDAAAQALGIMNHAAYYALKTPPKIVELVGV